MFWAECYFLIISSIQFVDNRRPGKPMKLAFSAIGRPLLPMPNTAGRHQHVDLDVKQYKCSVVAFANQVQIPEIVHSHVRNLRFRRFAHAAYRTD